jgi:AraC-like DNA-binding protein
MSDDALGFATSAFLQPGTNRKVEYLELKPTGELGADVEYCWAMWANQSLTVPIVTRSPAKGSVDLILPIDGNFCENAEHHLFGSGQVGAYLVGPLSQPAQIITSGRCAVVGMRFRPGRSGAFFRFPSREVRDGVLSIDLINAGFARELVEKVAGESAPSNQVAALQRAMLQLRNEGVGETTVTRAIRLIDGHHGAIAIDSIAGLTGTSVRNLERVFRETVGLSPKQLCRIARVRRATGLLTRERARSVDVVQSCGYVDQAHFIREFKAIVGVAPIEYLRERRRPCSAT